MGVCSEGAGEEGEGAENEGVEAVWREEEEAVVARSAARRARVVARAAVGMRIGCGMVEVVVVGVVEGLRGF